MKQQNKDIELKFSGNNASGKTILLNKIKPFLEDLGLIANISSKDEHKLIIKNENNFSY